MSAATPDHTLPTPGDHLRHADRLARLTRVWANGPGIVGQNSIIEWTKATGKPYGIGGVTSSGGARYSGWRRAASICSPLAWPSAARAPRSNWYPA